MIIATVYGPGGYIADHPNGNVAEQTETHPDGTATVTRYDKGRAVSVEQVDPPEPDPPTDVERLAAVLVTKVDTLTEADVAKALGVHEERVAAASAELSAEVAIEAAPIKGATR